MNPFLNKTAPINVDASHEGTRLPAAHNLTPGNDRRLWLDVRVRLVGRFAAMNQTQVANVLRSEGMVVVQKDQPADWIVVGGRQSPLSEADLIGRDGFEAARTGELQVLGETELWERLGYVDLEDTHCDYYTPAMLADLLGVSVRVIRRWHRLELIHPVKTLHQLHYYDFQEVATARRLAHWINEGAEPRVIEKHLARLVGVLPHIQRPLDQLQILVEGGDVLLQIGQGLIQPDGQMRMDFADDMGMPEVEEARLRDWPSEIVSNEREPEIDENPRILPLFGGVDGGEDLSELDPSDTLHRVDELEGCGDLGGAIQLLQRLLVQEGPRTHWCLHLGELHYAAGHVEAACERFRMAVELDSGAVEAWAALGMVQEELSQFENACFAFRKALELHPEYVEVHYQLAVLLDERGRPDDALTHWRQFLELAPGSPWADEARGRIACVENT
ncbi:MAG: tetratricopeptide repeat protein [Planctomycetota bacterium]